MEVVTGLYRLPGLQGVNAYIWHPRSDQRDDREPILFDCGFPWTGPTLVSDLIALGCAPVEVRTIAVTHDDVDHTGRLASLQAISGAKIIAHVQEAPRLAQPTWRNLPGSRSWPSLFRTVSRGMNGVLPHRPITRVAAIEDGGALPGGWILVHTPGHTPGHASYFHPARRILMAGDALGSIRRGHLRPPQPVFTEDVEVARASIRKLAALEPDVICFGHGPEKYNAAEALHRLAESAERE